MKQAHSIHILACVVALALGSACSGCRQLPKTFPSDPVTPRKPARRVLPKASKRGMELLPLPMRSQRDLLLSLRNKKLRVLTPPSFRDASLYPCTACHTGQPRRKRRKLVEHHKNHILRHGANHIWCYHCHAPKHMNKLRLADGKLVPFERSYLLCFQCHGDKTRDWVAGVHGRLTGYWSGPRRYLLCTHCHDPHRPRPKKLKPMPMPKPYNPKPPRRH